MKAEEAEPAKVNAGERIKSLFKKLGSAAAVTAQSLGQIVFPENFTCSACGIEIPEQPGVILCGTCTSKLEPVTQPCASCGGQLTGTHTSYCERCGDGEREFDRAYSAYSYTGPMRTLTVALKDGNCGYLARYLAEKMAAAIPEQGKKPDFITYVPISAKKQGKRGYNQSALLAAELSALLRVPVREVLKKTEDTGAQKRLSAKERRQNLSGSIACTVKKGGLKGKHILLADDVMTTGATAEECAHRLKKAGAARVEVITLCSTRLDIAIM